MTGSGKLWKQCCATRRGGEGWVFALSRKKQVAIQQKASLIIKASMMAGFFNLLRKVKNKLTCVCYVGQVIVLGAPRKLLQFTVWQVESPARGSLLERFFHATTGRYCGRQLGSIPSSHQTYRSTSSYTLFEAATPRSYPVGPCKIQSGRSSWTLSKQGIISFFNAGFAQQRKLSIPLLNQGLSIFQEVAPSYKMSQLFYGKPGFLLQNKIPEPK